MNLVQKFTDDTMSLPRRGGRWRLRVHESAFGGRIAMLVDEAPVRFTAPAILSQHTKRVCKCIFGKPERKATIAATKLKSQLGRVGWRKWMTQRPVSILGLPFDAVVVGRAVAALGARGKLLVTVSMVNDTPTLRVSRDGESKRLAVVAGMSEGTTTYKTIRFDESLRQSNTEKKR